MKKSKMFSALFMRTVASWVINRVLSAPIKAHYSEPDPIVRLPSAATECPLHDPGMFQPLVTVDWKYDDITDKTFLLEELTETTMRIRRLDEFGQPRQERAFTINLQRVSRLNIGTVEIGRFDYKLNEIANSDEDASEARSADAEESL